jgi:acyl carrier protein
MSPQDVEQRVLQIFLGIAADVDAAALKRDVPFRDQFDFDSMDMLNFAIGLNQEFAIEVPETTYRELATLRGAAEYVSRQLAAKESAGARSPG